MQNLLWKITLIVAVIGLCAYGLASKEIRLGKDLRGGVSLIYRVTIPEGVDAASVINQTIEVLKDRVNPTGVLDISMQPLGLDRIEVVMPLPSQEVRDLNDAYRGALDTLLDQSQIVDADLENAVRFGTVESRYCADETGSERCDLIADLQASYNDLQSAMTELKEAEESGADAATIAQREGAAADADVEYEKLFDQVLAMSLDRARVVRALGLTDVQEPMRDVTTGARIIDETTGKPKLADSARTVALNTIKGEFPSVAAGLDQVVGAYDAYQSERSGLDDPEDLIRLLQGAGVLEFHITVDPANPEGVVIQDMKDSLAEVGPQNVKNTSAGWYPINDLKQWYDGEAQYASLMANPQAFFESRGYVADMYDGQHYMLIYDLPSKRMTAQEGDWSITRTFPTADDLGRPAVSFQLDAPGAALLGRLTGSHVGKPMAIVLDGEVFSAPNLLSQISSNGIITGNFSDAEISYLIRVLAAGSLEARLSAEPIAVNTLGPSIGADNLERGFEAFVIAIIAVAIFMLIYYFFAGFVADLALAANGLIIFGVMYMIDGTFTLPGLAGIVLTIGMAVDANVLIYERIREEMFAGEEDIRGAVRIGFAKAFSTIIDANVTNLIVCLVLFKTATAEIKGFALTLTIGICATLFTALFFTRVIYTLYTEVLKRRSLPMLPTVVPAIHRFLEPSIKWISMRKVLWVVSAIAIVASVIMVRGRGVDMFDTEFRGGVAATMVTAMEANGTDRKWISQADAEQRIRGLATTAESAGSETERAVLAELENAIVLTSGDTRQDGEQTLAQRFQIKVANPGDIADEASIKDIVVDAIVTEFNRTGEIDVSPSRVFDGLGADAAARVFPIDDRNLGKVIGEPGVATAVPEFLGGVAIKLEAIEPPITLAEVGERIDQMRDQPEFADTTGRRTRVVGITPVDANDPDGAYRSVAVLALEPNLSAMVVDSDVWFTKLAQPEWNLAAAAMQRQSSLQQVSSFSSAVAETLAANAIVAVALSLLGILVYIWVRFGSLRYSAAAIVALVHDVTIALGLLALSGFLANTGIGRMLLIEDFRIDLGVVAALLTIIGYSLNDTIVILDRIRENRGKRPLASEAIVNRSINQTVSRTLLTSVTTLMAVLIMYAEGGSGIRPFTFCLLAGLLVGTYSSVAIAAPLVFKGGDGPEPEAEGIGDEESPTVPATAETA